MAVDFKKEEEVKEYLKNLEIGYKFSCHSEKSPEACHLLGDFYEAIKKDFPSAAKTYKMNCDDLNFAKSCHIFGTYLMLGKGLEKEDHLEAYRYFSKGCELDNADSCCNSGLILTTPDEKFAFLHNKKRGIGLLDKGCELGSPNACYFLSGLYLSGSKDKEIGRDMSLAAKYSKKACDFNNPYACSNLSLMYKKGDGVPQDTTLSEEFKKKALDLQKQHNDQLLVNFQRGPD